MIVEGEIKVKEKKGQRFDDLNKILLMQRESKNISKASKHARRYMVNRILNVRRVANFSEKILKLHIEGMDKQNNQIIVKNLKV